MELFYIVILWEMELVLESLSCFFSFQEAQSLRSVMWKQIVW